MSRSVHQHQEREPARRVQANAARAIFFPGEVARLLGLEGVEYDQLRKMFVLSRVLRGEPSPGRQWSRFTLADLAATEVLVGLGGGRERLARGRHLMLGGIEPACKALIGLGVSNPLLQVPMAREGRRILARVGNYVIEPVSGQLALEYAGDRIDAFLEKRLITDREVRLAIRNERRRLKLPSRVSIAIDQALGSLPDASSK